VESVTTPVPMGPFARLASASSRALQARPSNATVGVLRSKRIPCIVGLVERVVPLDCDAKTASVRVRAHSNLARVPVSTHRQINCIVAVVRIVVQRGHSAKKGSVCRCVRHRRRHFVASDVSIH
jgi:hypothetical protein